MKDTSTSTMIVKDTTNFHKEAKKHQSVRIAEPVTKRPELPHYPSSFNNRNEIKTDAFGGTMYGIEDMKNELDWSSSSTMIIHDDDYDESKSFTPVADFSTTDTRIFIYVYYDV